MGYVSYKQNKDTFWIYILQTYKNYQHNGIGFALLNCLEYMAYLDNISLIEGIFFPKNEFAKPLYDKCGYKIGQKKSTPTIYKIINKREIENNIVPNISAGNTSTKEIELGF